MLPPRIAPEQQPQHQQEDADDDAAVGEIERRPVGEADEVGDAAVDDTVDEVAGAAGDEQCERPDQALVISHHECGDHKHCNYRDADRDDQDLVLVEHAKGDAAVLHMLELQKRQHLDEFVRIEVAAHDDLGDLVRGQEDDHYSEQLDGDSAQRTSVRFLAALTLDAESGIRKGLEPFRGDLLAAGFADAVVP